MLATLLLAAGALASQVPFGSGASGSGTPRSVPIDISPFRNAKATSNNGENDGKGFRNGSTFPAEHLPVGSWFDSGVTFTLPPSWDIPHDAVKSDRQVIPLDAPASVSSVHLLGAGEDAGGFLFMETKERLGLLFEDGSRADAPFEVKHWWSHHWTNKSPIRAPFHFTGPGQKSWNATHLFHIPITLPPHTSEKKLKAIKLPAPAEKNALKVFAVSYVPTGKEHVTIPWARGTRRWENGHQIVQVAVRNPQPNQDPQHRLDKWVRNVQVELSGPSFKAVQSKEIDRLPPGDEVVLDFEVVPTGSSESFTDATITLKYDLVEGDLSRHSGTVPVSVEGVRLLQSPDYTEAEIEEHSAPAWYDKAKFGIFIHWGLFSVPAFAAPPQYAEWYDFWLHDQEKPTENHHRETYGAEFNYDDFIPMFTADKFNASEWMDVIAGAGAKYFVFTTKHHDGFAMFDTGATSKRNSLLLGPKRDILAELMTAAKDEHPELKRGTYFSLPEWFNPLYAPHGRLSFPGGPALNPFTRAEEPFTGLVDVGGFIEGIQRPQMEILTDKYGVDLLWCDIGLDNHSSAVFSKWYADAAREGREVAINNRCGVGGDFDTPEMTKFSVVQPRKWETCASMDPHSFGYNKATRDDEYRSAEDVIHSLVDIVAKGGNFLLNIGPRGDGSIPKAQSEPLREAGRWLKLNGRAIFDTEPYALLPEVQTDDVHVQFTRKPDAFYIISLRKPGRSLSIPTPAPLLLLPGDELYAITPFGDVPVGWVCSDGEYEFELDNVQWSDNGIAWVLEVKYDQRNTRPHQSRDDDSPVAGYDTDAVGKLGELPLTAARRVEL